MTPDYPTLVARCMANLKRPDGTPLISGPSYAAISTDSLIRRAYYKDQRKRPTPNNRYLKWVKDGTPVKPM